MEKQEKVVVYAFTVGIITVGAWLRWFVGAGSESVVKFIAQSVVTLLLAWWAIAVPLTSEFARRRDEKKRTYIMAALEVSAELEANLHLICNVRSLWPFAIKQFSLSKNAVQWTNGLRDPISATRELARGVTNQTYQAMVGSGAITQIFGEPPAIESSKAYQKIERVRIAAVVVNELFSEFLAQAENPDVRGMLFQRHGGETKKHVNSVDVKMKLAIKAIIEAQRAWDKELRKYGHKIVSDRSIPLECGEDIPDLN